MMCSSARLMDAFPRTRLTTGVLALLGALAALLRRRRGGALAVVGAVMRVLALLSMLLCAAGFSSP